MPLLVLVILGVIGFLIASVVVAWIAFNRTRRMEEDLAQLAQRLRVLERLSPSEARSLSARVSDVPRVRAAAVTAAPVAVPSLKALPSAPPAAAPATPILTEPRAAESPPEASPAVNGPPVSAPVPAPAPAAPHLDLGWVPAPPPATDWAALESMVGKRWMTWVGALVVFVAGAFFVHYAFTHGLIGPLGRMLLGLAAGVGVAVAGDQALRRDYRAFGQGLIGLGLGLVYASWYSGYALGDAPVVGQGTAFVGMIVATALGVGLSLAHGAQPIALLATLGGLLTPLLVSNDSGNREGLFAYLVVLDLGVVAVAFAKRWRALDQLAFYGTAALVAAWWSGHQAEGRDWATAGWVMIFAAVFLLLPLAFHLRRRGEVGVASLVLVVANAALATLGLWVSQGEAHPQACAALIALLAAGHAVIALAAPRVFVDGGDARTSFAGIAAALAVIAVPIACGGEAVTWSWAAQAVLLTWIGGRANDRNLRAMGAAIAVACGLRTLQVHLPGSYAPVLPLLHLAFLHAAAGPLLLVGLTALARRLVTPEAWEVNLARWGAAAAALWLAGIGSLDIHAHGQAPPAVEDATLVARLAWWYLALGSAFVIAWWRKPTPLRLAPAVVLALLAALAVLIAYAEPLSPVQPLGTVRFAAGLALALGAIVWARRSQPPLRWWLLGAGGVWIWALISGETWTATDAAAGDRTATLALSIAWIVYAIVLLTVGFVRRWRAVRFAALGMIGLTMLKLVLVDLSHLRELQRIASFAITGVVMIAASWAYHRLEKRFGGP